MSASAGLIWMGFVFVAIIMVCRWVAGIRDELAAVKYRVDKHHEALGIQLEYNRSVENHLDRLDGHTGSTRPFCAETHCSTTVGIKGARCAKCIRRLKAEEGNGG